MRIKSVFTIALAFGLVATTGACASSKPITPVKVLFAGSLIIPFDALEEAFEARHPDIDVQMEGHGSIQVIRPDTEIHDQVDISCL
jgi:molybdate/tungstate transport system substrate-binding protein